MTYPAAKAAGLAVLAQARWPASDGTGPAPIPGFALSSFGPVVADVAARCLGRRPAIGTAAPAPAAPVSPAAPAPAAPAPAAPASPAAPGPAQRVALVLVSQYGDLATALEVAAAVDAGRRVAPLLFFQSAPNSVLGHVAARWGLTGPVVCLSPTGPPPADGLSEGFAVAAGLLADGDADQALVIVADQGSAEGSRDDALAVLAISEGGVP